MKRILSLVLAMVMVLGSFSAVFAADVNVAEEAVKTLMDLGVLKEGKLEQDLKRQDAIVLLSRLMDEEAKAKDFPSEDLAFADVNDSFYKGYISWAVAGKLTEGKSATRFGFNDPLTAQQFAMFLLRALGYGDVEYDKALEEAKELGLLVNVEAGATGITRGTMAVMTVNALATPVKGSEKTLAEELGYKLPEPAKLAVKLEVNTAKSFLAKFNKAVADTSKFEFSVKRGATDAKVTVKWNEAKTEATLEAATKLAEGEYTVTVTDKTAEKAVVLEEVKLTIEKEKIVSIDFDSDVIVRTSDTEGVIGFVVKNQYGEDITNGALSRSLNWLVSTNTTPTIDYKAGVAKITHTGAVLNQLKDLKTVVATVRDNTTGFIVTKNFTVSDTLGIVNDIKLLGIIDEKGNPVDFIFSQSKTYYLDYEAFDVNGRKIDYFSALTTTEYNQNVLDIRSSNNGLVDVTKERHPQDNSKMALRLTIVPTTLAYDTPVTFIAVAPFTGKSSTITATLQRSARVDSFTIQAPAETATMNKSIEIPFAAYDQNGNAITRYEDLANGQITISAPAGATISWVRQTDGSAKLFGTFPTKQLYYVTATVNGSLKGSFSQISIDVKDTAEPTTIEALRHTRAYTTGGAWSLVRISSFAIRDQFDGKMDLRIDPNATNYKVKITSSNSNIISVNNAASAIISGNDTVAFKGGTSFGAVTITYDLMKDGVVDPIDTASAIAYNLEPKEIVSAKVTAPYGDEAYMLRGSVKYADASGIKTDAGKEAKVYLSIFGVTKDGMEVRVPSSMTSPYSTTDNRFTIDGGIYADGNFANATTAETTVTGHVYTSNGVFTSTIKVKANAAAPIPSGIDVSYEHALRRSGVINVANDVITVSKANLDTHFHGNSIFALDTTGTEQTTAPVYFEVVTQYAPGWEGIPEKAIVSTTGTGRLVINPVTGVLDTTNTTAGEYTITVIAANGIMKTVVIKVQ